MASPQSWLWNLQWGFAPRDRDAGANITDALPVYWGSQPEQDFFFGDEENIQSVVVDDPSGVYTFNPDDINNYLFILIPVSLPHFKDYFQIGQFAITFTQAGVTTTIDSIDYYVYRSNQPEYISGIKVKVLPDQEG